MRLRIANTLVEDVTITPEYPSVRFNGIHVKRPSVIRRVEISGTVDGIMPYGSDITIEDSWIHDTVYYPVDPAQGGSGSHNDDIQVQAGNNIQILRNRLDPAHNAAIMLTQDAGTTSNAIIDGNYAAGGGCSIDFGSRAIRSTTSSPAITGSVAAQSRAARSSTTRRIRTSSTTAIPGPTPEQP